MRVAGKRGRKPADERFFKFVDRDGPNGCWVWTGNRPNGRYGQFRVEGERSAQAHRFSWELANGRPIPDGLLVCHTCDNKGCVNPAHLFLGTQKDNLADRERKGRSIRGEVNGRAKLTADQVKAIRAAWSSGVRFYGFKAALARQYQVTVSLRQILSGAQWSHI